MSFSFKILAISALASVGYAAPLLYSRGSTSYKSPNGLTFNHFNIALPNVTIIATGGTIAGTSDDKTATAGYKPGVLGINQILSEIPEIFNEANIVAIQAGNIDSGDMTSSFLLNLTHTLQTNVCDDPTMAGAVITHGTDTLEESAFFLDATVNCGKPVVIVGSMRPATAISADGPMNLLQGVTVAASKAARDRGAMIVLNDRIVPAFFATKTNANTMDTFKALEQGNLGFIVSNKPSFYYPAVQPAAKHIFDVSDVDSVPRVDILYAHDEMQVDLLYSAVEHGAKGIVIAGEGTGGVSTEFASAIDDVIVKRNMPVVLSHRTVNGEVPTAAITGEDGKTPIASGFFNPQQSRIMLGLLLAQGKGLQEIRDVFLKATVANMYERN